MRRLAGAAAAWALAASLPVRGVGPEPPNLRLPAGVVPSRYAAELWLDPAKERFEGKIEIEISLKEETGTVWLNSKELDVRTVSARRAGGGEAIPGAAAAAGSDYLGLTFQTSLSPGSWTLVLGYSGRVESKETDGVFRQKTGDDWYVFTQFESIFARRAFPCFDEPSFKTPWQLTIHVPQGSTAASNTPIVSEVAEAQGSRTFVFAATKPLPSYLVAFAVGPFEFVNAGSAGRNRTPIRMIVPRGRAGDARFAVESTGPILEALEAYFGIPYPYEKLDELVIPQTVWAMENPGLVTYPSNSLLAKPSDETIRFRRDWASLCAHETAHQWFGDYVTMAWWDDIWLNEAFATWMASKVVERFKPEWNEPVERAVDRAGAMSGDALVTARRIRQPILTNDDIASAFDDVTYRKGAAVIAMFEAWVGEERFRMGIQRYLRGHAWGNATSDDFVAAIAETAKNPAVVAAFRSFLDQPGVPLVTADLSCAGGAVKLVLSQKRFLPTGSTGSKDEAWQVPVCARTGDPGAEKTCALLSRPAGEVALAGPCPARVLANAGSGYYRVRYGGSLLATLLADDGRHLSVPERVAALSDVSALARSGDAPMATALALVSDFSRDPNRSVVEILQRIAAYAGDLLVTDEMRPHYRAFVSHALGARARALGWVTRPGEDEDTRLLRQALVPFVTTEGDEPALAAEANRLAKAWLKERGAVDPLMVSAVLGAAARNGDVELFRAYVASARAADLQERARIFAAVGHFRDPAVVPAALALTLSTEFDPRETIDVLWWETQSAETLPEAWAFLKANFDALAGRLPRDAPADFPWMAATFSDTTRRDEVEAFFKDRAPKYLGGPRALARALEYIQLRAALKAAQQENVNMFLHRYEPNPTTDVKKQSGM